MEGARRGLMSHTCPSCESFWVVDTLDLFTSLLGVVLLTSSELKLPKEESGGCFVRAERLIPESTSSFLDFSLSVVPISTSLSSNACPFISRRALDLRGCLCAMWRRLAWKLGQDAPVFLLSRRNKFLSEKVLFWIVLYQGRLQKAFKRCPWWGLLFTMGWDTET